MYVSKHLVGLLVIALWMITNSSTYSAPVVPGTGVKLANVGDDFEDPNWKFYPKLPKSSQELDEETRLPAGRSRNGRWFEGVKRGCPDFVQRVPTPQGGLPGSQGALLMRTIRTGIPDAPSYEMQQDDLIANVWQRAGQRIPVEHTPSVVVRVFMPLITSWENRSGPTFGFRTSLETHTMKVPEGAVFFKKEKYLPETYWPGIFVEFRSQTDRGRQYDTAFWRIRGTQRGREIRGPEIEATGWWTLGMSITSDGMVHYYIKKGVEDLTANDHITSQFPYGYRAEHLNSFFFNVCSGDDGRTKSTDWVIDDPAVYLATFSRSIALSEMSSSRK